MGRYTKYKRFRNNSEYYAYLREKRNLRTVNHYETPILKNPNALERSAVIADTHIWKLGDRYYKLADQYYGDPSFWWVIAWYNSAPTESHLKTGDLISIPINLNSVLELLEVEY